MKKHISMITLCLSLMAHARNGREYDVVVYGGSPAAISAAVQVKRMGLECVVVCPDKRIGGLTTGGLGQTDIGNKNAFGGIALEFYRDIAAWYRDEKHWTRQKREDYLPDGQCPGTMGDDSMWTFEPSAALALVREYWGGMVKKGADTFWECYDPSDDMASPYRSILLNSYCHAWSCTPSYWLRRAREEGVEEGTSGK